MWLWRWPPMLSGGWECSNSTNPKIDAGTVHTRLCLLCQNCAEMENYWPKSHQLVEFQPVSSMAPASFFNYTSPITSSCQPNCSHRLANWLWEFLSRPTCKSQSYFRPYMRKIMADPVQAEMFFTLCIVTVGCLLWYDNWFYNITLIHWDHVLDLVKVNNDSQKGVNCSIVGHGLTIIFTISKTCVSKGCPL